MPVADLNVGMHLVEADGNVGVITGWTVVPGAMTMYNLEVAQDHTFTVGDGQWVVHNTNCIDSHFPGDYLAKAAPNVVTPGTQTLTGVYRSSSGALEPWMASYDKYGRVIGRTDIEGGLQGVKDPIHYHTFGQVLGGNMGSLIKLVGGLFDESNWLKDWDETGGHMPGVFDPFAE